MAAANNVENWEFDADGIALVTATLDAHLRGTADAIWLTADDGEAIGVAYCAPEPLTDRVWNLLMLWTRRDRSGHGHGSALVAHLQGLLDARGARMLIVETSGTDAFQAARAFYTRSGFIEEARIRGFYAAGDDKLIYVKPLAG